MRVNLLEVLSNWYAHIMLSDTIRHLLNKIVQKNEFAKYPLLFKVPSFQEKKDFMLLHFWKKPIFLNEIYRYH